MREVNRAFYTTKEAAEKYGRNPQSFREDVRSGKIRCPVEFRGSDTKVHTFFPKKKFDEWLENSGEVAELDSRRKFKRAS